MVVFMTRFILIETLHAGNVGGAARALKTMGFDELALVKPNDPKVLNRVKTKEAASGALDVLANTKMYDSLAMALEDSQIACATGMPHDMHCKRTQQVFLEPRKYFEMLLLNDNEKGSMMHHKNMKSDSQPLSDCDTANQNDFRRISFVFGNEKYGMNDQDIEQCHVALGIPTNPDFGSLNLASAVQVIAYDWRQAIGGF